MNHLTITFLVYLIMLTSCNEKEEEVIVPFVKGIPTIDSVIDSLNLLDATSAKWVAVEGNILYSMDNDVDWNKEFEVFRKSNINRLRYKDAYTVKDETVGKTRTVLFEATEPTQETQRMEVRLENGRIIYYAIDKNRDNLISNASHSYVYDGHIYSLNINQQIEGVFDNQQFVQGMIIPSGNLWLGHLTLGDKKMPLQFVLDLESTTFHVKNGCELIGFNRFTNKGDSLKFASDFFDSFFIISTTSDSTLSGRWVNQKRESSRSYSFNATKNVVHRFSTKTDISSNLSGEHTMYSFNDDGSIKDSTVLKLEQNHHSVSGSILTETGDYRFLEGVIRNDSLLLSTMDGTHAYLFAASIRNDSLYGTFNAGCCYQRTWAAKLGRSFNMRNPGDITQLKPGEQVSFSFPDANGKIISLTDSEFNGKPMVISLMGTWCSNCLDEAQFLKEAEELYSDSDLKIVALDFELIKDSARAFANIKRHIESLDIDYPVLLACLGSSKEKAAEKVSFLNGVYSYPTMIVLNKRHEVVRIHTGFNGPATGEERYEAFRKEYLELFGELVK